MKNNMGMVMGVGVVALLVGLGGGYWYGKSQASSLSNIQAPGMGRGNFAGSMGGNAQGRAGGAGGFNRGSAVLGEVLSKDDKSLTVKLNDGGSKIVFYSETTLVSKSSTTTVSDVAVGNNVMVNGATNSDGSVTASSIQLNPRTFLLPTSTPR